MRDTGCAPVEVSAPLQELRLAFRCLQDPAGLAQQPVQVVHFGPGASGNALTGNSRQQGFRVRQRDGRGQWGSPAEPA